MKTIGYFLLIITGILFSCRPQPEAINYGHDGCEYCKMTIIDKRYSAELVTDKGKVYKFDAIECMIKFRKENGDIPFALELVSTYDGKTLIPGVKGFYLRSDQLPSPMGMYITAFSNKKEAKAEAEKLGGELYSWEKLNDGFDRLPQIKPVLFN